ncbi:MAG: flippase [Spirochaetales bacterium]|nr:flippase [Spirochaetales bacterium]
MIKRFFKDGLIYSIPSFVSRGISVLLIPLYTRVLSPADYGAWDMLLVFMNLVRLTVALEISQAVARFYSHEKGEKNKSVCASTALWFTIAANGLFFVIAQLFAVPISGILLGSDDLTPIFRLGLVLGLFNGVFYLVQNQFRWELKSKGYALVSLIVSFVTAGLSVVLAYVFKFGLYGILVGSIAGSLTGAIYGLIVLRKTFRFRFSFNKLKPMLQFSVPLVFSGIAVFISLYIDRIMIRHFLTLDALGLYSLAFRFASVISLLMVGFNSALTPLIYRHYEESATPGNLSAIFRYFIFFALLAYAGMSMYAKEILVVFTTPEYYPAAGIIVFLVPAIILSNMYVFAPGINIRKKTSYILFINIVGAVLQFFFNYLLIPKFGYIGAAAATCLGNLCIFSMYIVISQRLYHVPHNWGRLASGIVVIVVLIGLSSQLELAPLIEVFVKLGLLCIAAAVLMLLGFVRIDEIGRMKNLLLKRSGI